MTSVTFNKTHDTYIFECTGHTGYCVCGNDILCSAVSILCYTMREYLEGLYNEGLLCDFLSDFAPGNVLIRFEFSDGTDEYRIGEAINAILGGFSLLEESFPDYISADI